MNQQKQFLLKKPNQSCSWIAEEYIQWLSQIAPFVLTVQSKKIDSTQSEHALFLKFLKNPIFIFCLDSQINCETSARLKIHGGLLAKKAQGHLEFFHDCDQQKSYSKIENFYYRLPTPIYFLLQVPLHWVSMHLFNWHLKKNYSDSGSF